MIAKNTRRKRACTVLTHVSCNRSAKPLGVTVEDLRLHVQSRASHGTPMRLVDIAPSGTKTRSCRPHVLVDEPTEEISPFDVGHAVSLFDGSETLGHLQLQSATRASPVVVLHIDPKRSTPSA